MERDGEPSASLALHDVNCVSRQVRPRHARNVGASLPGVEVEGEGRALARTDGPVFLVLGNLVLGPGMKFVLGEGLDS